jgi:hypothetical protein
MSKPNEKPSPAEAEVEALYREFMRGLADYVAVTERHITRINEIIGRVDEMGKALPKARKRKRGS